MSEPFIGEIKLVAFSYAPRGYAQCTGTTVPLNDNQALFALIGTTYGGNGSTTVGLPDLRGRSPIQYGTGPGLDTWNWGEKGGSPTVQLALGNIPAHSHGLYASNTQGNASSPSGGLLAAPGPALFTGEVPSGIPVTGTTTIKGQTGTLQDGKTSESREISGGVATQPYVSGLTPNVEMSTSSIGMSGESQPFSVQSPCLAMTYVIALVGLFPSRN
ncbi:tail fiber protein [uncultured Desulfobacter sp.]|uniref:phage tail protein n=1 Tax=uncultured Desulfobacter sp. TaxID=240139 RepID=UPI002AABE0F9|nr:tail fiber protein [uncultured Desulfobacter sp.]